MKTNHTPKAFCFNLNKIKAFVLGCDPTNFSDMGKRQELNFAFGIGQDEKYFKDILKNLNLLGLHLEDIYVQNLVKDYQDKETDNNTYWEMEAAKFLPELVMEFNAIDETQHIPVYLTAERLYKFLLNEDQKTYTAEELYNLDTSIPIPPGENKLNRPLIPLFRHFKYNLSNWSEYLVKLKMNIEL